MSRAKVAAIMALSDVDLAIYKTKRNLQSYWRFFSHDQWGEFCEKMGKWFLKEALNEWDAVTAQNKTRKAASDVIANEKARAEIQSRIR